MRVTKVFLTLILMSIIILCLGCEYSSLGNQSNDRFIDPEKTGATPEYIITENITDSPSATTAPSATGTPTFTPALTEAPTFTPALIPTNTPTSTPTLIPTNAPTNTPTPTEAPVIMVKKPVSFTQYSEGVAVTIEEYQYDDRGNQIIAITKDAVTGTIEDYVESQYDSQGRLSVVTATDCIGVSTIRTYTYDGLDVTIKDGIVSSDGSVEYTSESFQKLDEHGNIIYYISTSVEETNKYDSSNRVIEIISIPKGSPSQQKSRTIYEYNEEGLQTKIETYLNDEETPASSSEFEYTKIGNTLCRVTYVNGKLTNTIDKYELEDDGTWSKYYTSINGQPTELISAISYDYISIIDEATESHSNVVPTSIPTSTPEKDISITPSATTSPEATPTEEVSKNIPTETPTPTFTNTPTPEPTATPTNTPIPTPTNTPTPTQTPTPTPTPTPKPTPTPTPKPTNTPTPKPTYTPTPKPTKVPTPKPTKTPTPTPKPSLDYTSNDSEKAKAGKEGYYSYVSPDGNVKEYLFVDFDEGGVCIVDYDTKKPGESFGFFLKIVSGNLNTGVKAEGYTEEGNFSFTFKFKKKNDPSCVVGTSNDGFYQEYVPTNFDKAYDLIQDIDVYDVSDPKHAAKNTPTPTPSKSGGSREVYITKTGECYHFKSSCVRNPIPISLDAAIARGYRPCSKCAY